MVTKISRYQRLSGGKGGLTILVSNTGCFEQEAQVLENLVCLRSCVGTGEFVRLRVEAHDSAQVQRIANLHSRAKMHRERFC